MKRQHPIAADFRRPGSDHPHRRTVAHLGLLLGIWVLSMALLNLGGLQVFSGLTVGQRAPETLLAETDFTCVDLSATELARKEAADQVLPVFRVSMDNVASLERTLLKLADKAVAARADPAAADNPMLVEQQLHDLATARDAPLTGAEAAALFPPGQERLAATCLVDALHTVAAAGIAPDDTSTLGDRIDLEGSAPAPSPAADGVGDGQQSAVAVVGIGRRIPQRVRDGDNVAVFVVFVGDLRTVCVHGSGGAALGVEPDLADRAFRVGDNCVVVKVCERSTLQSRRGEI